uniref:Uncharacterized protein n=1 Tax=Felis catus TaxID=9685 RepID=A0ABI7WDV0_FELCA
MPVLLKLLTARTFSLTLWDPGSEPPLLFGNIHQNDFFFNRHFPPPEESAQTWQRFYLFNELKTLHDEKEAFRAPAFLFTNPRLTKQNKTKQEKEKRKKRKRKNLYLTALL